MNTIETSADVINIIERIKEKSIYTGFNRIDMVKIDIINTNIIWIQLLLYDADILPIKVDILKDMNRPPRKTIYLSPGSGLNIESNFITPRNKNLSIFLVNKGYMAVGVTPREDASPPEFNFELMKDWGLAKHTDDFAKVISLFQSIRNIDYDVLGHSAGALTVLNYSSTVRDNKLKVVRVIDVVGQYPLGSQEFTNAQISLSASNEMINRGIFINTENAGFKFMIQQAMTNPTGDSGFPRPYGSNFTNEALLFFSLIFTGQLPGLLTEITGLPSSWGFKQGFLSGTYQFGTLPTDDIYSLNHTNINTIYGALGSLGSGIYPLAYERDFYAVWSNSFPLDWKNIKVPVFYINTELGFGDASYTISLLKKTTYDVVRDYGHADPVYSDTADTDFWIKLVP